MNRYRLTKAGINVRQGLERFGTNQELYEDLLRHFPEDTNYHSMLSAIERQDAEGAFQAAHALKGVAGNLSLEQLYSDLIPLIEILRANTLNVQAYLPQVQADYERILNVLSPAQCGDKEILKIAES